MIPVEEIINKAGGQSRLAERLGIRQQSVNEWVARGRIPHGRVLDVERVVGVPRHEIRPDIYPPEDRVYRLERRA